MSNSFFKIGQKFPSFRELEKAIEEYEQLSLCKLHKTDSRKVDNRRITIVEPVKPELVYCEIKYACVMGGRKYKSRSKGIRQTKTLRKDCPMYIKIRLDKERQALEVRSFLEEHNHKPLPKEYLEKLLSKHERYELLKNQKKTSMLIDEFRVPIPMSLQEARVTKSPLKHSFILPHELLEVSQEETVDDVDKSVSEPVIGNVSSNSEDPSTNQIPDAQFISGEISCTQRKKNDLEIEVFKELKRTNDVVIKRQKTSNELFGELVTSRLDQLSESDCSQARIKILQTLHDIQFGGK